MWKFFGIPARPPACMKSHQVVTTSRSNTNLPHDCCDYVSGTEECVWYRRMFLVPAHVRKIVEGYSFSSFQFRAPHQSRGCHPYYSAGLPPACCHRRLHGHISIFRWHGVQRQGCARMTGFPFQHISNTSADRSTQCSATAAVFSHEPCEGQNEAAATGSRTC